MVLQFSIKIIITAALILDVFSLIDAFEFRPESRTMVGCISTHEALSLKTIFNINKADITLAPITVKQSIDLGYSTRNVKLTSEGACIDSALLATWSEIETIINKKSNCYALYDDGSQPMKITTISSKTNIPASLCPPLQGAGAPTLVLGGFTMHRISGDANPTLDTQSKLQSVRIHPNSRILDTCCGLGYTAIGAARLVNKDLGGHVTTIEYDSASIEMCSFNPWSQQLFDNSLPIKLLEGDSCEYIAGFDDRIFDVVIHDPPARALTRTDLYGQKFYSNLKRILRPNGQLFHYIGNPASKESGKLYSGIIERLGEAGFVRITKVPNAFGLIASV